ncbi:MAG: hypothetical protein JNL82_13625 [Myxococcales bacterium]|nr:hypothetical protein [Myxococcales bacterium]
MRRALIGLLLLAARPAAASQQCHPLAGSVWRNPGLLTGVRLDAAGYRNSSYEGDYQGLAPTLGFNHPRVAVMALLPAYRLTRNGRTGYGLGDLALAVRVPIPALSRGTWSGGLGLSATLPTGKAGADLGMGHVMLMPEFWFGHEQERVQLVGTVGFARALASAGAGHHDHGPRPIVNPMNLSEVDASLNSFVRVHDKVWLKLGMFGAMPVGTVNAEGVTRILAGSGLVVAVRGLEISAELQAPLAGAPFLARGVLQVGYRFELRRRRRPHAHHEHHRHAP